MSAIRSNDRTRHIHLLFGYILQHHIYTLRNDVISQVAGYTDAALDL